MMIFCYTVRDIIKEMDDNDCIPRVGEHVSFDGKKEFIVTKIFHDYASKKTYIKVRLAGSSDITFLG